jgi:hypothetical protein
MDYCTFVKSSSMWHSYMIDLNFLWHNRIFYDTILVVYDTILRRPYFYYFLLLQHISHLKLGKQWKRTVFYTFCVKGRIFIFNTKNLYENDTIKLCTQNVQWLLLNIKCSFDMFTTYKNHMLQLHALKTKNIKET